MFSLHFRWKIASSSWKSPAKIASNLPNQLMKKLRLRSSKTCLQFRPSKIWRQSSFLNRTNLRLLFPVSRVRRLQLPLTSGGMNPDPATILSRLLRQLLNKTSPSRCNPQSGLFISDFKFQS